MTAPFELADDSVVVVIGTGAGGGVLANELAQRGVSVVALEAGGRYLPEDYLNDEWDAFGQLSWLDPRKVRRVTVVGSRKMAVYDDLAEERLRIFDCGVEGGGDSETPAPFERPVSYRYGDIVSPHIHFEEPLTLEDRHFVDCIRKRAAPLSDGHSGMAVVAVLEAIDRALATGRDLPVEAFDLAALQLSA